MRAARVSITSREGRVPNLSARERAACERRRVPRSRLALAAALVALTAAVLPASAGAVAQILPGQEGLKDLDARTGSVAPTSAQRTLASSLGASVRWNRFGTPESLINYGGYLSAARSGSPADVARAFVRTNRSLFKLSDADVTDLELVNDSALARSTAHVV